MAKQPGLDNRHRDKDGEIHHKMGNTRIENLLDETGAKSLTDFRKNYDT